MADPTNDDAGIDLGLILWNAIPATWFMLNATMIARQALQTGETPDFSKVLLLVEMAALGVLFLLRRAPQKVTWHPYDVLIALFGTFAPLLLGWEPSDSNGLWIGGILSTGGLLVAFAGILSLGRSFGIVAANRGVKTDGMYRFVRHPIYFSYQIIHLGYFINHPTVYVAVVIVAAFIAQVLRIRSEEALLSQDPEYRAFQERTRYRLLPPIY